MATSQKKAAAIFGAIDQYHKPTETRSLIDLGKAYGVAPASLSAARLIFEHGTPEEISKCRSGEWGVRDIAREIRKRLPPEIRAELQGRNGKFTQLRRELLQTDSLVWAKLGPAITVLAEMPSPKDAVVIAKSSGKRKELTLRHLNTALEWLMEFEYEWSKLQLGKPSKDNTDA